MSIDDGTLDTVNDLFPLKIYPFRDRMSVKTFRSKSDVLLCLLMHDTSMDQIVTVAKGHRRKNGHAKTH